MATPNQAPSTGERLAAIEATLGEHTQRFNSLETSINARFAEVNARLTSIENRLTLILISTLAAVVAGFAGLIAAVFFR